MVDDEVPDKAINKLNTKRRTVNAVHPFNTDRIH